MKYQLFFPLLIIISLFSIELSAQCFPTQNFNNPGTYTYTLPGSATNTYEVEIATRGGDGGDFLWGSNPSTSGGSGATMTATYDLQGGDQLFIVVGQSGFDAIGSPGGGGGGGGSAVIINSTDVLIAAAAGGGGGQNTMGQGAFANTNSIAQGGAGPGTSGGGGFNSPGMNGVAGTAGGAGTLTSQGTGGNQGVVAGPGGDGFGGGGGGSGTAGGGGGGYKGGDGAANGSLNGKGGDSYISTLYNSTVLTTTAGVNGAGLNINGNVIITCNNFGGGTLPVLNITNQMDPSCFGLSDGSITVMASGGSGGFMYSINGGTPTTNNVFTGLAAGTYMILVTDSSGSTENISTTLVDPQAIVINFQQVVANLCNGEAEGIIEVSGQGGAGSYMYQLNSGTPQTSGLFENLISAAHTVTVIDGNGCSNSQSVFISQPAAMINDLFILEELDCFGDSDGQIGITLAGGTGNLSATFGGVTSTAPSGDTIQFNNISAGDIIIGIMDDNGCTVDAMITMTEPSELIGTVDNSTPVDCTQGTNGSADISAIGGTQPYMFTLDNTTSGGTFTDLAAGDYTAQIEDANGCISNLGFDIISSGSLVIDNSIINNLDCFGDANGSVELIMSGGSSMYNFTLNGTSNSTGLFENLTAGDYTVSIDDGVGCLAESMFSIAQPDELMIVTDSIGSAYIRVIASGGTPNYNYSIDGGNTYQTSNVFSNVLEGMYTIIVQDENDCTNSIDVNIIVNNVLNLDSGIQNISIYPIPASSNVSLQLDIEEKRTISYQLFTITGELILNHEAIILLPGQHVLELDISNLSIGTYMLKLKSDHGIYSEKIIKF